VLVFLYFLVLLVGRGVLQRGRLGRARRLDRKEGRGGCNFTSEVGCFGELWLWPLLFSVLARGVFCV
jgi:hypothetical protein